MAEIDGWHIPPGAILSDVLSKRMDVPTTEQMNEWIFDTLSEAACPCGAMVEHDGKCEHGRPSWVAFLIGV